MGKEARSIPDSTKTPPNYITICRVEGRMRTYNLRRPELTNLSSFWDKKRRVVGSRKSPHQSYGNSVFG